MGSNGLTSARHDIFGKEVARKYPESFDGALPDEVVYVGKRTLTEPVEGLDIDYGKLVLSPTRTYAPIVAKMLQEMRGAIHGMVHCTGGAQTKVLHFVQGKRVIKDQWHPIPPLFEVIAREGKTPPKEMYKVFNMGHRLEVYLPESEANTLIKLSESFGVPAKVIGRVEEAAQNELILDTPLGHFEYH